MSNTVLPRPDRVNSGLGAGAGAGAGVGVGVGVGLGDGAVGDDPPPQAVRNIAKTITRFISPPRGPAIYSIGEYLGNHDRGRDRRARVEKRGSVRVLPEMAADLADEKNTLGSRCDLRQAHL